MARYRLTPKALKDLDALTDHSLVMFGEAQTAAYLDAMFAAFARLADLPLAGRARDELAPGLRSFRQGAHLIVYRPASHGIDVIAVPHGAMDIDDTEEWD